MTSEEKHKDTIITISNKNSVMTSNKISNTVRAMTSMLNYKDILTSKLIRTEKEKKRYIIH